jgi:very-short-patch-repair endonuclease
VERHNITVLRFADAANRFGRGHTRWMLSTQRWQSPIRGVVVMHSGTLTAHERLLVNLTACGRGAVLAGLSAATFDGLTGFSSRATHVLLPPATKRPSRTGVVIHRSRNLGELDVHPTRSPRRTRIARSIVDAAAWAATDEGAIAIVAASVQQRLVRGTDLRSTLERLRTQPRRALILDVVDATDGGSLSEYEIAFLRLCRWAGLPVPDRQVRRQDSRGRSRYSDAEYDAYDLVVEIDGAQHMEFLIWCDDLERENDLVIDDSRVVIRFAGWSVKHRRAHVVERLHTFMRRRRPDLHPASGCKVCRLIASSPN